MHPYCLKTAIIVSLLLQLLLTGCKDPAVEYFISPSGSDHNTGTIDEPFASLEKARDQIRELKKEGLQSDVIVYLREGTYFLSKTLVLGLEDAAPDGCDITYRNYPGERPVISSGVRISGWTKAGNDLPGLPGVARGKIWSAGIPEDVHSFHTLYEGDTRLQRAVTKGFFPTEPYDGNKPKEPCDLDNLHFPKGRIKNWSHLENVEIFILPSVPWTMNILPLEWVNEKSQIAKTGIPATYPLKGMTGWAHFPEGTVWVENVFEGLDEPGNWVLDTNARKLYLWPVSDEPGNNIMAPKLRVLFKVAGESRINQSTDIPVKGIHFKGLTFTHTDRGAWGLDDSGIQHDWEMEDKDNAMLRFRGAEECTVDKCHFFNAGGNAVRLDYHARKIEVRNSLFHDLGASAVVMLGYGPGTKDVNKKNKIVNNLIHDCGQIWWHSQMITVWQSGENLIAHNYIHHVPRKAICISGVRPAFFRFDREDQRECRRSIRFGETGNTTELEDLLPFLHSRNNIVEYNHIHHVLEKLGDGAAINVSGAGTGNIIRYNYIHDINNQMADACIRTDNAQNGTMIMYNIVADSYAPGFCAKGENVVRNNFLINVSNGNNKGMIRALGNSGNSDVINNIFLTGDDRDHFYTFIKNAQPPEVYQMMSDNAVDKNVYFNTDDTRFKDYPTLTALRKNGFDRHSIYTDPLFENWEEEKYRLKQSSPALELGIQQINITDKVGLTEDYPQHFSSHNF